MTKTVTYVCDWCDRDLTTTKLNQAYRVIVASDLIRTSRDPIPTTLLPVINQSDPYPEHKHFCNNNCLIGWISK